MPIHHLTYFAPTPAAVRLFSDQFHSLRAKTLFPDGFATQLSERPGQTAAGRGEGRTTQPEDKRRAGKAGEEGEQDSSFGAGELLSHP